MQLRDFNPNINHPGRWGYFSGSIQVGEKPIEAARRELQEEISYQANDMVDLGRRLITDMNDLVSYIYRCSIEVPMDKLILHEGVEMMLATPDEIRSKKIFSKSLGKFFPVAETSFVQEALTLALSSRK